MTFDSVPGWIPMHGVSGAGWDIWCACGKDNPTRAEYAIFKRSLNSMEDASKPYEIGRLMRSGESLEEAMAAIRRAIHRGAFDPKEHFPADRYRGNPRFGAF